jgi:2-polyprenyl-3-methyl-5-hydroxy-6-metoxy-1,4-benzoquinol methylase
MAERASPTHPGFQRRLHLRRKGLLPWIVYSTTPYAEAARWRFRWVASKCRGKDVLDIPCGMGWGTSFIRNAKSVVGIDVCRGAIEEASAKYPGAANFLIGSMEVLPFASESFDVVSCLEGIEHVPIPIGKKFIAESFRVLRPHGRLLLSSPYCLTQPQSSNPYHIHEYQPDEIKKLLGSWFEIISIAERDVDNLRVLYIEAEPRRGIEYKVRSFLGQISSESVGARSKPDGETTLYGSVYRYQAEAFLGYAPQVSTDLVQFLKEQQDIKTGLLVGPELRNFQPDPKVLHDIEHLQLHSTVTALPFYQENDIKLRPINAAHVFCDLDRLKEWCEARDWKNAWFEGNNILFVGQLLVYLRDFEKFPGAQAALDQWFDWLESEIDPQTSLWGTNGHCSPAEAVYGGYHQLLVYWHEGRNIKNPKGLVDTVLGLQHHDGGFNPQGNAGACEDVDSVDILVNCYKRWDYRREEIRCALWRCVDHILATQNANGGFPYNRNMQQTHMHIPGTDAEPNESCAFPTWFRVHTFALCAEIIPEHPAFKGIKFGFNKYLSMGWHASPDGWRLNVSDQQFSKEQLIKKRFARSQNINAILNPIRHLKNRVWRLAIRAINKLF